jgi:hypothetical protein
MIAKSVASIVAISIVAKAIGPAPATVHAHPAEVVKAGSGAHFALLLKTPAVASVPTGEAVMFVVMMDDGTGHEQDQNQPVEREACKSQHPQPFKMVAGYDGGWFVRGGEWFGHKKNDPASARVVTIES